jgi:hypothetical protein
MSLLQRLRAWWNKDAVEQAEEEVRLTPAERDVDEEDFEARKDDIAAQTYLGRGADYEGDEEPPPDVAEPGR